MPSTSAKQHRFMEGIAHGMKPRSGKGPSAAVAKDFVAADHAKKLHEQGKRQAAPIHARVAKKTGGAY